MMTVKRALAKGYKVHSLESFTDPEEAKIKADELRKSGCFARVAALITHTKPEKTFVYYIYCRPYKKH